MQNAKKQKTNQQRKHIIKENIADYQQ